MKRKILVSFILILVIITSVFLFTACDAREDVLVFRTSFSVYVQGPLIGRDKNIASIISYVQGLDPIISVNTEDSDLDKINKAKAHEKVKCNQITMDILKTAKEVYELSGGAFDPSIYPLVKLWKFDSSYAPVNNYEPPKQTDIEEKLKLVGLDNFDIDFENNTVTKRIDGVKLDLGGIAKGYAVDKAQNLLGEKFSSLLNLGGNISVKNDSYHVEIANPDILSQGPPTIFALTLNSGECISTSGGYERYYRTENTDGTYNYYYHIINPKTGKPMDTSFNLNGKNATLLSVSVISSDGALGDALSTALMVLGYEEGIQLIKDLNLNAIFVSKVEGETNLDIKTVGNKFE